LPIGDYDKHAIGQKDYEALAEEVMAGMRKSTAVEIEASRAEEILRTTKEYLDTVEPVPMSAAESDPETETAESFPYPARSSYSAMIDAIAGGALPEWSDKSEEPDN
jgi:hypothetical protein